MISDQSSYMNQNENIFTYNDGSKRLPFLMSESVLLHSTNTEQLDTECGTLYGNDYAVSSKHVLHEIDDSNKCNLPSADVTRENIQRLPDQYEHRTEASGMLVEQNKYDQDQASDARRPRSPTNDSPNNNRAKRQAVGTPGIQVASSHGHLYRINMSDGNNDLGFVVPCELIKLPMFNLYANGNKLTVQLMYIGIIDFKKCQNHLGEFGRYIFAEVFDNMNTRSEVSVNFDMESPTLKLLPCLLNSSNHIDYERMASICTRKNKLILNLSDLKYEESYIVPTSSGKQLYVYMGTTSSPKCKSDQRMSKKSFNTTNNNASYPVAVMKRIQKPNINYFKNTPLIENEKTNMLSSTLSNYLVKDICYAPLNQMDFQLIYKLPSILVRIAQLYHIEHLRQLLDDSGHSPSPLNVDPLPVVTFGDCLAQILSSNQSTALPLDCLNYEVLLQKKKCEFRLSPDLLFQSITCRSAEEMTDMENLETLGDCFLKLAMSLSLYHRYLTDDVGFLTQKRSDNISNGKLHQISVEKKLNGYLNSKRVLFTGTNANWMALGFTVDQENTEKYVGQRVNSKAFADMIEALIGALLVSTDYVTTMKFMQRLGLGVIPNDEQGNVVPIPSILSTKTIVDINEINDSIGKFYNEHSFIDIEDKIKYCFKNKAYLIAAYTHRSYLKEALTMNYIRLKFVGNALFEYLITRYIFVTKKSITPDIVSKIRQDLLAKTRQADIMVTHGLHTKILCRQSQYLDKILSYTTFSDSTMNENNTTEEADPGALKALSDVFEALIGAIFLDAHCSLKIVWDVILPLLQPFIDDIIDHPNIHPVDSFVKEGGTVIEIVPGEKGNFVCTVKSLDGTEIKSHGKSKKKAKCTACKKAKQL